MWCIISLDRHSYWHRDSCQQGMVIKGAHRIKTSRKADKWKGCQISKRNYWFCVSHWIHKHCNSSNKTEYNFMDEFFCENSRPCILITTGNTGVQLLTRNQPHYCHVGNLNHYLHNKFGHSFISHNTLLTWRDRVCRLEIILLYKSSITFYFSSIRSIN